MLSIYIIVIVSGKVVHWNIVLCMYGLNCLKGIMSTRHSRLWNLIESCVCPIMLTIVMALKVSHLLLVP